jgi:hypothetical protein
LWWNRTRSGPERNFTMTNQSHFLKITVGDTRVVIQRLGSTTVIVANILTRETRQETESVYLDQMIHQIGDYADGWNLGGGNVTVLSRRI